MKNTKKIYGVILAAILLITVAIGFSACHKRKVEPSPEKSTETTAETATSTEHDVTELSDVTIEIEETTEKSETTKSGTTTTTKKSSKPSSTKVNTTVTKKAVTTTKKQQPTTQKTVTTTKKQEPTTKKTEPTTKRTEPTTKFSCTSANHNCTTKEEHDFICGLEAKGCPICGSHSCRSFYAKDEWGNNCYDISKCPQYSVKEDPSNKCEHCGREVGIGDNGTCLRFTVDTVCPICGKTVKAKTCHTH